MRRLLALVLIGGGMLALPAQAWADGFISPYFGVNFSGDTTKNSTVFGGSLGFLGKAAGFEVDFGYTPDFFGSDTLDVDGKTATLMANVLIGGRNHTFSPYIALGAGLIRTDISSPADVSYEVDVWGRVRRTVEAARADAQASEADLAAVRLTLHAELATEERLGLIHGGPPIWGNVLPRRRYLNSRAIELL